jgi:hypothetical protein
MWKSKKCLVIFTLRWWREVHNLLPENVKCLSFDVLCWCSSPLVTCCYNIHLWICAAVFEVSRSAKPTMHTSHFMSNKCLFFVRAQQTAQSIILSVVAGHFLLGHNRQHSPSFYQLLQAISGDSLPPADGLPPASIKHCCGPDSSTIFLISVNDYHSTSIAYG